MYPYDGTPSTSLFDGKPAAVHASTAASAFAAGCGIVDEIRDVQIPVGSPVVALVFQRQGV